MPQYSRPVRCNQKHHSGFALMESMISVVLVGALMIVSLQAIGASHRRESTSVDRILAQQLTSALTNEILLQAYQDPDLTQASEIGLEQGEETGNRSLFDDVDDYAGWSSSPPQDRNGVAIPGFSNWTQSADVQWADPMTLQPKSTRFTGLKQITVTASKGGRPMASGVSYRSVAWVDTIPAPTDATGNRAPVAVAMSPNLERRVGEAVSFDASGSSDPDGDYLSYVWDFGDGTKSTGKTVSKTYTSRGLYSITLTAYDGRGGTGSSALTAFIYSWY